MQTYAAPRIPALGPLDLDTSIQILPPPNLPIVVTPTDLESALDRFNVAGRAIPLSEIPDIDPIVLIQ